MTSKKPTKKAKPAKRKAKAVAKRPEQTSKEMDALLAEAKALQFPPRMKITENDGASRIEVDHPDSTVTIRPNGL